MPKIQANEFLVQASVFNTKYLREWVSSFVAEHSGAGHKALNLTKSNLSI